MSIKKQVELKFFSMQKMVEKFNDYKTSNYSSLPINQCDTGIIKTA